MRFGAVAGGKVKPGDIVLGQRAWPTRVQQVGNAFQNQLETPILFYAGIAFALILESGSAILVMLAWTWFGLRLLHAGIHVTTNSLRPRFMAFAASALVLLSFWIVLTVEVMSR